ncbi:hypothetical protein CEUSTIGMA_g5251.t1 [Chlamydomonas eustigma]|uniref:Uncharacterized protein n=1 Tax=Chlamydomonas eustigma TaxID=1157962 RepID=A0A250X404_9CHLO|nr:hypothetical protein CEUSTIGMA_g5251.t1 [Chlamydomonas eustigma]|eukprot:GAX77808.1 hypothetical protein CEUSTIGMA_g5251.t1 [Chlamydomonas eustigma]
MKPDRLFRYKEALLKVMQQLQGPYRLSELLEAVEDGSLEEAQESAIVLLLQPVLEGMAFFMAIRMFKFLEEVNWLKLWSSISSCDTTNSAHTRLASTPEHVPEPALDLSSAPKERKQLQEDITRPPPTDHLEGLNVFRAFNGGELEYHGLTSRQIIEDLLPPRLETWAGGENEIAEEALWRLMQQLGLPPEWGIENLDRVTLSQRARAINDKVAASDNSSLLRRLCCGLY